MSGDRRDSGGKHSAPPGRGEIGRQIVLPMSKAFEISWRSIRLRIWRSLITMSGIILAIAFLMSVWTSSTVTSALREVPEQDSDVYRAIQKALREQAIFAEQIEIRVGVLGSDEPGGGFSPHSLIHDSLQLKQEFEPVLLPAQLGPFTEALMAESEDEKLDALVVTGIPAPIAAVEGARAIEEFVQQGGALIVVGYEDLWPSGVDAAVTEAFGALWPARAQGDASVAVNEEIADSGHMATADVAWNDHPPARYVMAQPADGGRVLASIGEDGIVWLRSAGQGSVLWYAVAGRLAEQGQLVRWIAEEHLLVSSLRWGARHKFTGGVAATRDLWLVSLSLLVCIVGITNAMLMSVTERFREIGTMKCLGALDSFVVRLFLIESSLMGAVGSLAGVLVGFLLAFSRSMFSYHVTYNEQSYWLVLRFFPGSKILMWAGIAVAIGAVLSIVAAVYPAYRAARMEPVEAMRAQA